MRQSSGGETTEQIQWEWGQERGVRLCLNGAQREDDLWIA